ncbi:MAG TPA: hypothetical protein VN699_20070 [Pirellulales bacterium]|nr:hypothetical protein [Pirellulales bacterium]
MQSHGTFLTVVLSAAAACWLGWPTAADRPDARPSPEEVRDQAVARVERSLAWADDASRGCVALELAPLDEFFADVKTRTPRFAEGVLGWSSKWRFVADKLPFAKGGRHAEFLRQAFNEQLFAPDDLSRAIEQVARGYGDSLTEIENQMLVKLREDLSDLPPETLPRFSDPSTLSAAYQAALQRTAAHIGSDLKGDVSREVVSLIAGEVLAQVAVRLGVSAGILGAGASSSWATLGAGLVVGLIVDQLVSWVWDWWADPRGNLAAELNAKFDALRAMIVEGDAGTPGLRSALEDFGRRRAELRRAAVLDLLKNQGM